MIEIVLCLVVGVADGDTLTARCGEPGTYSQVKVRLAEIDAPERRQAFGRRSKAQLVTLCAGTIAQIAKVDSDRYGRIVARVQCRGQDASAEQLRTGMAWVFTKYSTDPSLMPIELEARASRTGLWADPDPVPPWEWRRQARP